jgi:hypothetical protein
MNTDAALLLLGSLLLPGPSPAAPGGRDPVGVLFIAVILVLGGLLNLFGAFRARRGEFKTTIGRQMRDGLGPRGAVVLLLVLGVLLVGGGLALALPSLLG